MLYRAVVVASIAPLFNHRPSQCPSTSLHHHFRRHGCTCWLLWHSRELLTGVYILRCIYGITHSNVPFYIGSTSSSSRSLCLLLGSMFGQTSHTIQALLATSKTLYNKPRLCSLRSKCVSIYSEIASSPLQLTLRPSSRFRLVRDPLNVPNFHLMPNQCVPNMQHLGRASPPQLFSFLFFFLHAFSVPQLSESTPPSTLLPPPPPSSIPPPSFPPPVIHVPHSFG